MEGNLWRDFFTLQITDMADLQSLRTTEGPQVIPVLCEYGVGLQVCGSGHMSGDTLRYSTLITLINTPNEKLYIIF